MRFGFTVLALAAVVALPRGVAKADDCTCADSPSVAEVCVVAPVSGLALPASVDAISADTPLSTDAELVAPTFAIAPAILLAPKPSSSSHTVLWCGGADGARCEPAAPANDSFNPRLFALPYLLLPRRVALAPAMHSEHVFFVTPSLEGDGVESSVDRPPRA